LFAKGYTQVKICRILGLKKQKVSYWAKTPIKNEIIRHTKLDEKYKKRIIELAEDKLTSDMGSRKIAEIINKELKENNAEIQKEIYWKRIQKRPIRVPSRTLPGKSQGTYLVIFYIKIF